MNHIITCLYLFQSNKINSWFIVYGKKLTTGSKTLTDGFSLVHPHIRTLSADGLVCVSVLQACAAYSFITIPSLSSIFNRLSLYLLSGQAALANQCLSQGEQLIGSSSLLTIIIFSFCCLHVLPITNLVLTFISHRHKNQLFLLAKYFLSLWTDHSNHWM